MILAFILGALAGLAVPYLEPHVKAALDRIALKEIEVAPGEIDLVTLALLLLVAALLSGGDDAIALMLGALVGVFGKRILAAIQGRGGKA